MSLEAWGDDGGADEYMHPDAAIEAGWWPPDLVDEVKAAVQALYAEPVYEDGQMVKGISVRYLARLTLLRFAAQMDVEQPLVDEADATFREPPGDCHICGEDH